MTKTDQPDMTLPEPFQAALRTEAVQWNGSYYQVTVEQDSRAEQTWEALAGDDPIVAAAASPRGDPFVKLPGWLDEELFSGVVLDAGCGYGRVAIPLLERQADLHLIGVDSSAHMLDYFGQLAGEHGVESRICLIKSDLSDIPLHDHSVDQVITSAVLLHNAYPATEAIVRELFRCLKPGGTAVFESSFPNLMTLNGVQKLIYASLRGGRNGPVRPYSRDRVRNLLTPYCDSIDIQGNGITVVPNLTGLKIARLTNLTRGINRRLKRQPALVKLAERSGLLVTMWQVRARKRS